MYHKIIYGASSHDPNLLFGQPRPIRSDEWLTTTQLTIAQQKVGFPHINQNLGSGKDLSMLGSIPYKDWPAVFKSENFAFFVLPLENAFAFKWWFMLYGLIVSSYFFTLRFIKNNRVFAALFSTAIGLSPFIFWWYSTVTLMSLLYGFLILIVGMRIINGEPVRFLKNKPQLSSNIVYSLSLAYLLTAFALILYPPFQIPVSIVVGFFLVGYLLSAKFEHKVPWKKMFRKLLVFAISLAIAGVLIGLFVASRKDVIKAISKTAYPGLRVVESGHLDPLYIFDSFLQPQLESDYTGNQFFKNQSEASNFILLSPFLVLPALLISYMEYRKKRRVDWVFLAILLCALMFFARALIPLGDPFYKLFFLHIVPHERLIIGMGFASIILTVLVLKKLGELRLRAKIWWALAAVYSLACFGVLLYVGFRVADLYPRFISYTPKIIVLAVVVPAIIFFVLARRLILAAGLLLVFSLSCVAWVHPVYQGLGWIKDNELFSRMQHFSKPADTWVVTDKITLENFGLLANHDSISGIQPYPDFQLWRQAGNPGGDVVYNRYAHVIFDSNPTFEEPLYLIQPDFFKVGLSCSNFITTNVDFVLATTPLNQPCVRLKDKVVYPAETFLIYKVNTPR